MSCHHASVAAARNDAAFSYRDARWAEVIVGVDPDPANLFHVNQNITPSE